MAAGQTNPLRQSMINMMYLVLIALLALNVSAEILNAFQTLGEGMDESLGSIEKRNNDIMAQFQKQHENDPEKVGPFLDKAKKANRRSDSIINFIDGLQEKMVTTSGGRNAKGEIIGKKNMDVPSNIMLNKDNGKELKKRINQTRDFFIGLLKPYESINVNEFKSQITLGAEVPEDENKTWSQLNFQMMPTIAAVTLLSKMKNDVRTAQSSTLERLIGAITAEEMSFDRLTAIIKNNNTSLAENSDFETEIMLGAYSSTVDPNIYVDGKEIEVENGKGKWKTVASSPGQKEHDVKIQMLNPKTGDTTIKKSTIKYDVFKSPAIISADKTNVIYKGIKNPVSASVSGYKPSQIRASITHGKLTGSNGDYNVLVNAESRKPKTTMNVSVKTEDGGTKNMGQKEFRIKPIPKPTAYFGTKSSGNISTGAIDLVRAITARMPESFLFEGIDYQVVSYKFVYQPKNGNAKFESVNGPRLNSRVQNLLSNPSPGDQILVTNIDVKGPDGKKRLPSGIVLTVE